MEPFEAVLSIIPTLTYEQKDKIKELLGMNKCEREGHNMKKAADIPAGYFAPARVKLYCTRCGHTTTI